MRRPIRRQPRCRPISRRAARAPAAATRTRAAEEYSASSFSSVVEMLTPTSFTGRQQALQLAAVEIGEEQFAVAARLNGADTTPIDDASAATSPPTLNSAAPAKTEVSQPTAASPGTAPDVTARPAARTVAFPPIPVLTVPRFTSVHTTNTGPTLPDPQGPLDGRDSNSRQREGSTPGADAPGS